MHSGKTEHLGSGSLMCRCVNKSFAPSHWMTSLLPASFPFPEVIVPHSTHWAVHVLHIILINLAIELRHFSFLVYREAESQNTSIWETLLILSMEPRLYFLSLIYRSWIKAQPHLKPIKHCYSIFVIYLSMKPGFSFLFLRKGAALTVSEGI